MAILPEQLLPELAQGLLARGWLLAVAESCTGGWVAKLCTDLPGSSAWFERGFVTYSNAAKQDMLGVQPATLQHSGAVSEAVVLEMVSGVLKHSPAHMALGISGIAGPGGGTPAKPVGTVCFAWGVRGHAARAVTCHFAGDRMAVRQQAVHYALSGVLDLLAMP